MCMSRKYGLEMSEAGHAVTVLVVVVVLAVVGLVGWEVAMHHNKTTKLSSSKASSTQLSAIPSANTKSADNNSLQASLNGIDSSMNTEANDGSATNNALNDQQSEVTVPTN
jgi:predicted negative regulator of RcsB-dependent stress response